MNNSRTQLTSASYSGGSRAEPARARTARSRSEQARRLGPGDGDARCSARPDPSPYRAGGRLGSSQPSQPRRLAIWPTAARAQFLRSHTLQLAFVHIEPVKASRGAARTVSPLIGRPGRRICCPTLAGSTRDTAARPRGMYESPHEGPGARSRAHRRTKGLMGWRRGARRRPRRPDPDPHVLHLAAGSSPRGPVFTSRAACAVYSRAANPRGRTAR